jgi:putative ATP-binding cassette transporter
VTLYRSLAEWSAVIERLAGFEQSVATARRLAAASGISIERGDAKTVTFKDLAVKLPSGVPLVNARDVTIALGEHVLVSGPSGVGKSTLFRALAGVWPFGEGNISLPKDARMMILPQRPYFPIAPLAAAVAYPSAPEAYDAEAISAAIAAAGLPALADRLDEEAHWNRMLSLGEQQRLGVARALLHAPDFLFLDEATASLDEAAEAAVYRLLQNRLPHATVVSIGHRSTLAAFHRRRLAVVDQAGHHVLSEAS